MVVAQNKLRTFDVKHVYLKINFKFSSAVDLYKYIKSIKLTISLYTCAPISELPFNVSTIEIQEIFQLVFCLCSMITFVCFDASYQHQGFLEKMAELAGLRLTRFHDSGLGEKNRY